jgi:predicted RND superfamily exporter protein
MLKKLTLSRARWTCLLALLLLTGFLLLNLRVPSAGIVQDALLDHSNRYDRWQAQAQHYKSINQGDALSFVLSYPGGVNKEGLEQLIRMSDAVKKLFPEGAVWSLASNSYDYRTQAGVLESQPYLHAKMLDTEGRLPKHFDLQAWKQAVAADASVYNTLIGKQFDYAQIFVFLPENYSEQGVVDRVAQYLEKREIHQLEWLLLKGDIHPVDEFRNVSLGGWSIARGLMHYALISDVLFYSTTGLLIATIAAVFSLGSWRQALQVTSVIFVSFVVVRGAIPLMAWLGISFYGQPVYERVYFLLVLSALIVAGISFNVRAFEAFNDAWRKNPQLDRTSLWKQVAPIRTKLNVVALIAFVNFATLPQIGIRGILEVGVLSALGIAVQRLLVITLLPSLHIWLGGLPDDVKQSRFASWFESYGRMVDALPRRAYRLISGMSSRRSTVLALSVTGLFVAAAMMVVAHDVKYPDKPWILVQERPIDYLPNTIVDRGRALLNQADGAGFGRLAYLVVPSTEEVSAKDPKFIARTYAFEQRMGQLPGAMPVRSILDKLSQVAQRSPDVKLDLPATTQQSHELLQMMRWDLENPKLANYFWSDQGYVIFASHAADNSRLLRQYSDAVMQVAATEFPDLKVLPFGRLHTYHQTDVYISQGKPLNVLTSFPLVLVICATWLFWASRRAHRQGHVQTLHPVRTALAISLPFVFAYSLIVLLMAIFSIPLDQATACATALGINAAIDFDIYVVDDFQQRLYQGDTPNKALHYALAERGRVTLIDAKLNAICFSFLMLSPFLPIQRLGVVMLVMLAACALGALVLMTAVLRSCVRNDVDFSPTRPFL